MKREEGVDLQTLALADETFLESLPPLQQGTVKKYAQANGLSFRAAYAEIMGTEIEENVSDRSHR